MSHDQKSKLLEKLVKFYALVSKINNLNSLQWFSSKTTTKFLLVWQLHHLYVPWQLCHVLCLCKLTWNDIYHRYSIGNVLDCNVYQLHQTGDCLYLTLHSKNRKTVLKLVINYQQLTWLRIKASGLITGTWPMCNKWVDFTFCNTMCVYPGELLLFNNVLNVAKFCKD